MIRITSKHVDKQISLLNKKIGVKDRDKGSYERISDHSGHKLVIMANDHGGWYTVSDLYNTLEQLNNFIVNMIEGKE